MKVLLISVVLLQAWCNAAPKPNGVAHYSYQDSTGKRFPFGGFPFGGFGAFNMDRLAHNSAFAGAAIGPGYTHQSAMINPPNAANPNIDITDRYAEPEVPGNFYSVSSSSFASSNNDNGKVSGFRGAETVVNNNGKVTKYRVHS